MSFLSSYSVLMRCTLVILCFVFILPLANVGAQNTNFKVNYKQTKYYTEDENMPGLSNEYTTQMVLYINGEQSLYAKDPEYKEPISEEESGFLRRMMSQRAKSMPSTYKNLKTEESISKLNFFDKDFLIVDSLRTIPWKISAGEQKTIAGYNCIKAIFRDSTHNVVVFFAPALLSSHGPDSYFGLPGLILEVQSAALHAVAIKIESVTEPISVQVPQKGTKVTESEYQAIRAEKIKERKEMMQNRSPRMIIR